MHTVGSVSGNNGIYGGFLMFWVFLLAVICAHEIVQLAVHTYLFWIA